MAKGKFRYRYENLIFSSAIVLGLATILFLCCYYTIWSHNDSSSPHRDIDTYVRESQYISKALTDLESMKATGSLPSDSLALEVLETLDTIRCSQILLLRQHENLVNDFRQEMNNNINKVNTWLAFAIGIISILGVFIPLVLQYRLQNQDEARFNDLVDRQKRVFKERLDEMRKMKDSLAELKDSLNELKEEWSCELELSELGLHFNAFQIGAYDSCMQHHPNREEIFRRIWNKAVASFSALKNLWHREPTSGNNGVNNDQEVQNLFLIEGLIKLYAMVHILKNHDPKRRHRLLWRITDKIDGLLNELKESDITDVSREIIDNKMTELLKDLNELHEVGITG